MYFNPSFAGNIPYPRISAGYRNQWAGLGNAFVTYYAAYDQYVPKMNGGLGLGFSRDLQGNIVTRTSVDLVYNYLIKWRKVTVIPGIQTSLMQYSLSANSLSLGDQNPYQASSFNEYIPSRSQIFPDFTFGISIFLKEQYQVNFSVHHVNYMRGKSGDVTYTALPMYFNIQLLGTTKPKTNNKPTNPITVRPALSLNIQPETQSLQWGANVFYSQLFGGIWFRNNIPFTFNTFIFNVGYNFNGLTLGYSFDWWVPTTNQKFAFFASHEVTLVYLFQYNDPKKKMKPVSCPNFYENLDTR